MCSLQAVKQSPKLRAILEGEQFAPSARDLGLNKSPVLDRSDKLPQQLENLLGQDSDTFGQWANPISGHPVFN